jgi:hypothetical protein
VATQIIAAVGAVLGAVLGRVAWLPMLIVVGFGTVVGLPLYFLTSGARRRMVFAGALQAGHALWLLLVFVLVASGTVIGVLEPLRVVFAILLLGGGILVVLLPYLPVIIILTLYQTAMFMLTLLTLAREPLLPAGRAALFLDMFLRVLAIAMMFLAYFEKPKDEEQQPPDYPPDDDFQESHNERWPSAKTPAR